MTLDAHVTGIWCGQIGGGVGKIRGTLLGGPHNKGYSIMRAILGCSISTEYSGL